jgi:hypothetical protein
MQEINYRLEILSTMTNSDIVDIILWKKEEARGISSMTEIKLDSGLAENDYEIKEIDLIKWWFKETKRKKLHNIQTLIRQLEWEIKRRKWDTGEEVDLNELKSRVNITDVIQSCTDISYRKRWQNIQCLFPEHIEISPSFAIFVRRITC